MTDNKRKMFFDTYGKSLSALLDVHKYGIKIGPSPDEAIVVAHDIYICPFCLKNFFYFNDGKYYETETFSEDHFPPKSVGGTKTALVCKPCNSSFGLGIDHALKQYLKFQSFLNKNEDSSYPLKFNYKGIPGSYNIETKWNNGIMVKNVDFKNYPYVRKWATDLNKREWEFSMKFSAPSQENIQKALLRSAYVSCFSNWGYDFVYSKAGTHIRNVLHGKEAHPLSNLGVFGNVSTRYPDNGFYYIANPKEYQAFIVFFDIGISNPNFAIRTFVIVPRSDDQAWQNLTFFQSWIEHKKADTKLIKLYDDCIKRGTYLGYSVACEKFASES